MWPWQWFSSISAKQDAALGLLNSLERRMVKMAANLQVLTDSVSKNTNAVQSAITLLNGLAAKIAELKTDPVALQALADELNASSGALADAVVANTPAMEAKP